MGFVNPWDKLPNSDESELFHEDWGNFDRSEVAKSLRKFVRWLTNDDLGRWFLIWAPLRHRNYMSDPKRVISNKFYFDDFESDEVLVEKIFGKKLGQAAFRDFLSRKLKAFSAFWRKII